MQCANTSIAQGSIPTTPKHAQPEGSTGAPKRADQGKKRTSVTPATGQTKRGKEGILRFTKTPILKAKNRQSLPIVVRPQQSLVDGPVPVTPTSRKSLQHKTPKTVGGCENSAPWAPKPTGPKVKAPTGTPFRPSPVQRRIRPAEVPAAADAVNNNE